MTVTSTVPTSRRGYLSQGELEQYADITVTNTTEADDRISQAEELIDAYVGYVCKFFDYDLVGKASAAGGTTLTLQSDQQNLYDNDYFRLCEIEILSGTGAGQRRTVTSSTKAGVLTVTTWTANPSTDSIYKIIQLGKFPRDEDVTLFSSSSPYVYIKHIPENVKRAVVAQVEFFIEMGDKYFKTDESGIESESLGDYSYSKGGGGSTSWAGIERLISPKAKLLLKGYIKRIGKIIA